MNEKYLIAFIFSVIAALNFISCEGAKSPLTPHTVSSTATGLSIFHDSMEYIQTNGTFSIVLSSSFQGSSINLKLKVSHAARLAKGITYIPTQGDSAFYSFDVSSLPFIGSFFVTAEDGKTIKAYTVSIKQVYVTTKEINEFKFTVRDNPQTISTDIKATIDKINISFYVPYSTNVMNLVPTIKFYGKDLSPKSGEAQNFSSDQTYTVTAEDGSKKAYIVRVHKLAPVTYTVSFNNNGGLPLLKSQTVISQEMAKDPHIVLKKQDFFFAGWYDDMTLNKAFDFNSPIEKNVTLYAKWISLSTLESVVKEGIIPVDISHYDEIVNAVLKPYTPGKKIKPIYLTPNGGKMNKDGSSWINAYAASSLKSVIDNIQTANTDTVYLVLLGVGKYPVITELNMKNNVAIVGGFSGIDWTRPTTDTTQLDGESKTRIFRNNGLNNTALIYGVKIMRGETSDGAGMYNINSSPSITNVVFSHNRASGSGSGYKYGGGMCNINSSPVLTNVIFSENYAMSIGGGMYNENASPILWNVVFVRNSAFDQGGGGMCNVNSSPILINIIFSDNYTNNFGGALVNTSSSAPILTNVVFSGNYADNIGGGMYNQNAFPQVTNAIFWNNLAKFGDDQYNYGSNVTYSVVQAEIAPTIDTVNPRLNNLTYTPLGYSMPTITYNGTSPDHKGIYIKMAVTDVGRYVFYYSINKSVWYIDPRYIRRIDATPVSPPANAVDITSADIQGIEWTDRPDIGVWKK